MYTHMHTRRDHTKTFSVFIFQYFADLEYLFRQKRLSLKIIQFSSSVVLHLVNLVSRFKDKNGLEVDPTQRGKCEEH